MQPINTKASTTRPMAKARSRRDSRFISIGGSRVGRLLKPK